MFIIEDEIHSEWSGEFQSFQEAVEELKIRSRLSWNVKPNICPCQSWKTCSRDYYILEFDTSYKTWIEKSRILVLSISEKGKTWHIDV